MEGVRNRVGMLCDQLSRFPDLHDVIRDAGADGELDKLLAALGGVDEPDEDQVLVWLQAIEDVVPARDWRASPAENTPSARHSPESPIPGRGCVRGAGATAWSCRKRHERHRYARWTAERQ